MTLPPSQRDLSDEDLAARARDGCAASFEQLARRFQVPLLRFLGRRVPSHADAEDLVQETFVRAWRRLDGYQPGRRFSTWLFTIAYRIAVSHHRGRKTEESARSSPTVLGDLAARSPAPPGPADAAAGRECGRRLWDVAERVLSEEQFTALWLYYVEGMDTRDMSKVMDKSWVAVKTMLFRARARLMPFLGEWADGESREPGPRRTKAGPSARPNIDASLFAVLAGSAAPAAAEVRT